MVVCFSAVNKGVTGAATTTIRSSLFRFRGSVEGVRCWLNIVLFASGVYREEAEHAAIFRQAAKQLNTVETLNIHTSKYIAYRSMYIKLE